MINQQWPATRRNFCFSLEDLIYLTRLPSQTTSSRWQVDKEAIGLSRVQQFSHLCVARPYQVYAGDIVLPSHTRDQVQRKTTNLKRTKKDKSINKQQPDTATYRDQQSLTRVRQLVHLSGQHHQSPRLCRRTHQDTIGKSQVSI